MTSKPSLARVQLNAVRVPSRSVQDGMGDAQTTDRSRFDAPGSSPILQTISSSVEPDATACSGADRRSNVEGCFGWRRLLSAVRQMQADSCQWCNAQVPALSYDQNIQA